MGTKSNNPGFRKTTAVLAAAAVMLALFFLGMFVIYPKWRHYYVMHRDYEVYGGMTAELKDSELYDDMTSGKSFCFLGDSITEGTVTEGIPWYQPLVPYINGEITNISKNGWTIENLIDQRENIPIADVYVIAVGINDVLFPDWGDTASSASVYAEGCAQLAAILKEKSPDARIYFIAPWSFYDVDEEFYVRGDQFREALSGMCSQNGYQYIDTDPVITSVLEKDGPDKYMFNNFHPNAPEGVGLFSYAVLKSAHDQRA